MSVIAASFDRLRRQHDPRRPADQPTRKERQEHAMRVLYRI
jgi:hypothetical protein